MKLNPSIISTQTKKESIMQILDTKFKDIFSSGQISIKYKNYQGNINKVLINQIYEEKTQIFLIFILEMTFLQVLNYFNGQIQDEQISSFFKKNYKFSDDLIDKFINNFDKIGKLHDNIKKKWDKDDEDLKNYLVKINVKKNNNNSGNKCIESLESKDKKDISSNNLISQQNPYETFSNNNDNFYI